MASFNHVEQARREGVLLGIPLGDLGWFQSLLMGVATGFAAFFATTFCAIMALLFYFAVTHHPVDFAIAYKRVGFHAVRWWREESDPLLAAERQWKVFELTL